jgi:hypothetical protein
MRRKITPTQRRHADYLRKKGLKVGLAYETRLRKLRRKEVGRLLSLCRDVSNTSSWEDVIAFQLDESYLGKWYNGLYIDAGLPQAKSTARDMSRGKAEPNENYWRSALLDRAEERAGEEIVLLQGTFRDELIGVVRNTMTNNPELGVEALARKILKGYAEIELWQARRIAQTETMISLAEAGDIAARTLDVGFNKQWIISGIGNTRETHEVMDGVIVDMNEPFELEDCQMMYPHDGSMGAPAGEIINCACGVLRLPK